ncbi:MAG: hypothetical protein ABFD50_04215, partial [Smithella sp.]
MLLREGLQINLCFYINDEKGGAYEHCLFFVTVFKNIKWIDSILKAGAIWEKRHNLARNEKRVPRHKALKPLILLVGRGGLEPPT